MKNPLAYLSPLLIDSFIDNGLTIFVRQSYPRGLQPGIKESFLITPHRDIEIANQHFQHIQYDNRKHIYHAESEEEKEKLYNAASQPPGYLIYCALLRPEFKLPQMEILPKITSYIRKETNWKPKDGSISAELIIHFGDLQIMLTGPTGKKTVNLEDIEKL